MTNIIDRACAHEEELREDALRKYQREHGAFSDEKPKKTWKDSAKVCERCDEPIPMRRRKAQPGTQVCVNCKALIERANQR